MESIIICILNIPLIILDLIYFHGSFLLGILDDFLVELFFWVLVLVEDVLGLDLFLVGFAFVSLVEPEAAGRPKSDGRRAGFVTNAMTA